MIEVDATLYYIGLGFLSLHLLMRFIRPYIFKDDD